MLVCLLIGVSGSPLSVQCEEFCAPVRSSHIIFVKASRAEVSSSFLCRMALSWKTSSYLPPKHRYFVLCTTAPHALDVAVNKQTACSRMYL